jgi:transposase
MVGFPKIQRYYLYTNKTDMRKSVRGLSGLVLNEMKLELRNGDGFVFFNKRKTMVKILVWDRTGFVVYYKQLSTGTFELPIWDTVGQGLEISMRKLMLIMEGVQLKNIKYRKRYCG